MKRILTVLLCLIILSGCKSEGKRPPEDRNSFITGVWITYSEVDDMLKDGDYKTKLDITVKNCRLKGITDIFLAVRPFCNSLYRSEFFPQNEYSKQYDFDVLNYTLERAHAENIRIHAWINPYRVSSQAESVEELPDDCPVRSMELDKDYVISNGIYLEPSSPDVVRLITEGVREICTNYRIDGIHFDDYFYPTSDESFDKRSYDEYIQNAGDPLTLNEFRTANVNSLISSVYTAVKFCSKDIVFSVSPCASIEKNKKEYYADIKTWCENGCVDMIIPQLYFGFEYPDENYRFDKLLEDWEKDLADTDTMLVIGLAAYKTGTDTEPDKEEWVNGEDIIKRQTEICRNDDRISGFVYFSYSYTDKI